MESLIKQINRRNWWHSPPIDKLAYTKRGVFLASSYKECEFYGCPIDEPIKVNVTNPVIDTEENIIKMLFGRDSLQMKSYKALVTDTGANNLKLRFALDEDMYKEAKKNGYDAIAIVTEEGLEKVKAGKLSKSVELNVFDVNKTTVVQCQNK